MSELERYLTDPPAAPFHEISDAELLEELRAYERLYGLVSEDFYARWQAGQFEDSFETDRWAVLYREAGKVEG